MSRRLQEVGAALRRLLRGRSLQARAQLAGAGRRWRDRLSRLPMPKWGWPRRGAAAPELVEAPATITPLSTPLPETAPAEAAGPKWRALLPLPGGRPWRLPGGLRPWITCMSLGFLMAALLSHGRQMRQYNLDSQGWLWLLLGVGCCLLSLVVSGLAWVVILRWLGLRPR
jgi:hypothetical protein